MLLLPGQAAHYSAASDSFRKICRYKGLYLAEEGQTVGNPILMKVQNMALYMYKILYLRLLLEATTPMLRILMRETSSPLAVFYILA